MGVNVQLKPEIQTALLEESSTPRQILRLGTPVLIEQLLLYLVGFSDTLLTARFLSVEDLAAVTVGSYLTWFLGSLLMVASAGGTTLVARSVGAGDRNSASRLAQQAIQFGGFVGLVMLLVGFPTMPGLVRLLGLKGLSAGAAVVYLQVVLCAMPLVAVLAVCNACLRGAGDTRTGMWVMVLVNAINVVCSWVLATGWGPFPRLGLAGVAAGTAMGEGTGGIVMLALLFKGRSGLKLRRSHARLIVPDLRRLLRISVPAALESGGNSVFQLWFLEIINRLGDVATAAHGVAIRCEAISFLTVNAFAVPASTLTGQYLGAARPDRAARSARTAWIMGLLALSGLGAILFLVAGPMFDLFLHGGEPQVKQLGVPLLRLVAFAMPLLATINILSSSLRGAGDTRVPLLIVLFGYLVVRIPLTYLLTTPASSGGLGWGLYGAWMAMFADLAVRASLILSRFLSNRWAHVEV